MIAFILTLFDALAAIPKILGFLESFAGAISYWLIQRSTHETLSQISDAAALAARANSTEERLAAAQKWHDALSRPRKY